MANEDKINAAQERVSRLHLLAEKWALMVHQLMNYLSFRSWQPMDLLNVIDENIGWFRDSKYYVKNECINEAEKDIRITGF